MFVKQSQFADIKMTNCFRRCSGICHIDELLWRLFQVNVCLNFIAIIKPVYAHFVKVLLLVFEFSLNKLYMHI